MISPLWWLPLAVAAAAVYPIWRGIRRLHAEAAGLQASILELRSLRPQVDDVIAELALVAHARQVRVERNVHVLGHR